MEAIDNVSRPGYERIPENWYTRNLLDPHTLVGLSLDTVTMALEHLEFLAVGGNTGEVDTFTGLDPDDLTGGVFNAATLLEENNALCFALELTIQATPDILSGLFTDIDAAEDLLGTVINTATDTLGCPVLNEIDKGQFNQFPGYTQLATNGTY